MSFENTGLAITALAVFCLGGLGYAIYKLARANPNMQAGELLTYILIYRTWDIFVFVGPIIMLVQALSAASIQASDEPAFNTVLRSLGHLAVGVLGYAAITNVPIGIYRIVRASMDKKESRVIVGKIFMVIGYFLLGMAAPLINLFVVASSCGQYEILQIFLMQIFYSSEYCREYFIATGLPLDYSAASEMYPILYLDTLLTFIFHPAVCIVDGVYVFAQGGKSLLNLVAEIAPEKKLSGDDKDAAKKAAKAANADVDDTLKNREKEKSEFMNWLDDILTFYGGPYKDANKRKTKVESLASIFSKHLSKDDKDKQEKLLSSIATLDLEIRGFKEKPAKGQTEEDVKRKIQEAFRKKPSEGGFGEDLPSFR